MRIDSNRFVFLKTNRPFDSLVVMQFLLIFHWMPCLINGYAHTHTRLTALFRDYPGEPVQKGKINLDFTEARESDWQWHQLGCMQVCTSLQTDNHARTPPPSFLQDGRPSCRPTNSVKALKATFQRAFQ